MNLDQWDTRPNGDIAAQPLAGWSIASLPTAGLVRLDYLADEQAMRTGALSAVQLALGPTQARELAQALLRLADKIDAQPLGTRQ